MVVNPENNGAANELCSTRVIRVLFVIPESASKSSMIFAHREIAHLKHAGVACEIFPLAARFSLWALVRQGSALRQRAKSFPADLVHAGYGTVTAFLTVLSSPVPVVVSYRGSDLNPCPSMNWLRSFMGRILSQLAVFSAHRTICVSEQLRQRLWWRRERALVIPTGVDTAIFHPHPRNDARFELGWDPREKVVLFNAGAAPRIKRLDLAEAALEAARQICGAIRFVVLNGEVPPKEVALIMNAADCLLFTSDWEGSPAIVQEALACNLPIVSVDVGDLRERLNNVWPSEIVG
jgi:teichuronic acid biosynthesis glycosyltransferase TuaC